jgi:hypothetical protein
MISEKRCVVKPLVQSDFICLMKSRLLSWPKHIQMSYGWNWKSCICPSPWQVGLLWRSGCTSLEWRRVWIWEFILMCLTLWCEMCSMRVERSRKMIKLVCSGHLWTLVEIEPVPQLVKSDSLSGASESKLDVPATSVILHQSKRWEKLDRGSVVCRVAIPNGPERICEADSARESKKLLADSNPM